MPDCPSTSHHGGKAPKSASPVTRAIARDGGFARSHATAATPASAARANAWAWRASVSAFRKSTGNRRQHAEQTTCCRSRRFGHA